MARYEYRYLWVSWERVQAEPTGRVPTAAFVYKPRVLDSLGKELIFLGGTSDDAPEPEGHMWTTFFFLEYLNHLGRQGWRLVHSEPARAELTGGSGKPASSWPFGHHLLERRRGIL